MDYAMILIYHHDLPPSGHLQHLLLRQPVRPLRQAPTEQGAVGGGGGGGGEGDIGDGGGGGGGGGGCVWRLLLRAERGAGAQLGVVAVGGLETEGLDNLPREERRIKQNML